MRQNLLETYSRQISAAQAYVAKNFDGKEISNRTKLTTAVLLDNLNNCWNDGTLTESVATNRADLGSWKKFCLNLTNVAVPSLIANDLVIVQPMTSYSGAVAYLEYVATTDKNGQEGKTFNSVFGLGEMSDGRVNYTSQIIVESGKVASVTPVVDNGLTYEDNGEIKSATYKSILADGSAVYGATVDENAVKIAYVAKKFQMESVPAEDIPSIGPKMRKIPLVAEPRRIAVRYDQITAFQAKTDYGFSLEKQIAEQAIGELTYEIDTEIVDMLKEGAGDAVAELTWSTKLPVGVSMFEHYNSFLKVFEDAKAIIYKRTGKFSANYMVCAANIVPILCFVNGWKATKGTHNGPYKAGELNGVDVYVSPRLADGEFFFGLNGADLQSSAGVYAPYLAIVPTQVLGTPDGGLAQGFSTWYAKALLNKSLLVAGKITNE